MLKCHQVDHGGTIENHREVEVVPVAAEVADEIVIGMFNSISVDNILSRDYFI